MVMEKNGLSMVTSFIAKFKTSTQMTIIIFTLIYLGLRGLSSAWTVPIIEIVKDYELIYYFTLFVTIFTVFTGLTYVFSNRKIIYQFLREE